MICLSRPDESALQHLKWNQSPPPLAPDQTTCQDLNGICNLREHSAGHQGDGSQGVNGCSFTVSGDEKCREEVETWPEPRSSITSDAGRLLEPSLCLKTVYGGEGYGRLFAGVLPSWCNLHLWGCAAWVISVIVVSSLISLGRSLYTVDSSSSSEVKHHSAPAVEFAMVSVAKRSTCVSGGVNKTMYDLPLHVGALFIILFVSTLACAFPLLAKKFPGLRISGRFFFAVRHFGTGVLIATAFVHLLPTAFISLGDSCLDDFWIKDYPAMPGAIALAAIFFVIIIEMLFHPARQIRPIQAVSSQRQNQGSQQNMGESGHPSLSCMGSNNDLPMHHMGSLRGNSFSMGQELSRLDNAGTELLRHDGEISRPEPGRKSENTADYKVSNKNLTPEQRHRKELLQCVLLELGILFHSVFIGMALSVSVGNEFIILLIAVAFHQTFEGLALGSRISAIKWPHGVSQPWFMALAYGCTTPVGQAIGLATHTLYSPDSKIGLIVVGVMNAISAGLLTFASLVELLSEDFLSDESWRLLCGKRRVYACLLVLAGALMMSLVGAWA